MKEKLVVEIPPQADGGEMINSWLNLPRLIVSAKLLDTDLFPPDMDVNFLTITVESIYNLPSSWTDDMEYKASTVIYVENDVRHY